MQKVEWEIILMIVGWYSNLIVQSLTDSHKAPKAIIWLSQVKNSLICEHWQVADNMCLCIHARMSKPEQLTCQAEAYYLLDATVGTAF